MHEHQLPLKSILSILHRYVVINRSARLRDIFNFKRAIQLELQVVKAGQNNPFIYIEIQIRRERYYFFRPCPKDFHIGQL